MMKTTQKPILTPKGVLVFPKLVTPDTFKGKTTYNTKMRLDPNADGVQDFITKLEGIRDAGLEAEKAKLVAAGKAGAAKKLKTREVFTNEENKEGEDTGFILVSAKMAAEYVDKKTSKVRKMKPTFFDSRGNSMACPKDIWGGTVARLGVKPAPTLRELDAAMGVTLYLDAVFIIELVAGGGKSADYYGFEAEEDGYVATKTAADAGYDEDDDDGEDDDDADTDDEDGDGDF